MVVSALQGLPAFCEQRGKDDPAVSWQGCEDRRVALLTGFPHLGIRRLGDLAAKPVELAMGLFDLPINEPHPFDQVSDVSSSGLNSPGSNEYRRFSQSGQYLGHVKPPNAAAFQQFGNRTFPNPRRFVGRAYELPKVEEPFCRNVIPAYPF